MASAGSAPPPLGEHDGCIAHDAELGRHGDGGPFEVGDRHRLGVFWGHGLLDLDVTGADWFGPSEQVRSYLTLTPRPAHARSARRVQALGRARAPPRRDRGGSA